MNGSLSGNGPTRGAGSSLGSQGTGCFAAGKSGQKISGCDGSDDEFDTENGAGTE